MRSKRIAVQLNGDDIDYIRRHMNPHDRPFAEVLKSIIHEVVRDDRAMHRGQVNPPQSRLMAGR